MAYYVSCNGLSIELVRKHSLLYEQAMDITWRPRAHREERSLCFRVFCAFSTALIALGASIPFYRLSVEWAVDQPALGWALATGDVVSYTLFRTWCLKKVLHTVFPVTNRAAFSPPKTRRPCWKKTLILTGAFVGGVFSQVPNGYNAYHYNGEELWAPICTMVCGSIVPIYSLIFTAQKLGCSQPTLDSSFAEVERKIEAVRVIILKQMEDNFHAYKEMGSADRYAQISLRERYFSNASSTLRKKEIVLGQWLENFFSPWDTSKERGCAVEEATSAPNNTYGTFSIEAAGGEEKEGFLESVPYQEGPDRCDQVVACAKGTGNVLSKIFIYAVGGGIALTRIYVVYLLSQKGFSLLLNHPDIVEVVSIAAVLSMVALTMHSILESVRVVSTKFYQLSTCRLEMSLIQSAAPRMHGFLFLAALMSLFLSWGVPMKISEDLFDGDEKTWMDVILPLSNLLFLMAAFFDIHQDVLIAYLEAFGSDEGRRDMRMFSDFRDMTLMFNEATLFQVGEWIEEMPVSLRDNWMDRVALEPSDLRSYLEEYDIPSHPDKEITPKKRYTFPGIWSFIDFTTGKKRRRKRFVPDPELHSCVELH